MTISSNSGANKIYSINSNTITGSINSGIDLSEYIDVRSWDYYKGLATASILTLLKEDELIQLLETVKSRCSDEMFVNMTMNIIASRHFSEDFILKYIPEDFSKYKDAFVNAVLQHHNDDVRSTQYNQLYLLFELNK